MQRAQDQFKASQSVLPSGAKMKNLAIKTLKSMEKLRTFKEIQCDADDVLDFGVDFLCQLFQECELNKEQRQLDDDDPVDLVSVT